MRIIAGAKRGMKLLSPEGQTTRPVTDRVKESLFNILFSKGLPADCVVADLFCGTGSMGLEALSRGASWAAFVDSDAAVVDILRKNIEKSGFVRQCKSICADVFRVAAPAAPQNQFYDLVFVDPPYKLSLDCSDGTPIAGLMTAVGRRAKDGGMVLLRTHRKAGVGGGYGPLAEIDRRVWGDMMVVFFRKKGDNE